MFPHREESLFTLTSGRSGTASLAKLLAANLPANSATAIFGGLADGLITGTTGSSIENVFGGAGNDILLGDNDSNVLEDGLGDDLLKGGPGDDFLQLLPGM